MQQTDKVFYFEKAHKRNKSESEKTGQKNRKIK